MKGWVEMSRKSKREWKGGGYQREIKGANSESILEEFYLISHFVLKSGPIDKHF